MCEKPTKKIFQTKFYSPGHVPILIARPFGERRGHTELAVRLCELAGLTPCAVLCEMLDEKSGGASSAAKARRYASRHDLAFLEGRQFI